LPAKRRTSRLTDEEFAALKEVADGRPISDEHRERLLKVDYLAKSLVLARV